MTIYWKYLFLKYEHNSWSCQRWVSVLPYPRWRLSTDASAWKNPGAAGAAYRTWHAMRAASPYVITICEASWTTKTNKSINQSNNLVFQFNINATRVRPRIDDANKHLKFSNFQSFMIFQSLKFNFQWNHILKKSGGGVRFEVVCISHGRKGGNAWRRIFLGLPYH